MWVLCVGGGWEQDEGRRVGRVGRVGTRQREGSGEEWRVRVVTRSGTVGRE